MRFLCLPLLAVTVAMPQVAAARSFSFADLQALIEAQHIRSIEALLPALPGPLRERYALMFSSRSLQGASFEAPRAILYGPDARFIVTFNGDRGQRGYNMLETMEFDERTQRFEFREISFAPDSTEAVSVSFSPVNPARCGACHGMPARPVWDTPPLWPGAYGERYDAKLSTEESSGMAGFLARQPADPRYRQLLETHRFSNPATFRPNAQTLYAGALSEAPNAELSALLDRLVSQSVVREMTANPYFRPVEYLLLGVSDGRCGGFEEFYPSERARALRASFADFQSALEHDASSDAGAKRLRLISENQRDSAGAHTAQGTSRALRFVVEEELGMPTESWSLAFERGTFGTAAARDSLHSYRDALLLQVQRDDPKVRALSDYATSSDGDRYCKYLKQQSRQALEARRPLPALAEGRAPARFDARAEAAPTQAPPALRLCIACHQSDAAPLIAFSDKQALKAELQTRAAAHGRLIDEIRYRLSAAAGQGRMPLGFIISDDARDELERYFRQLAALPP